MNRQKAEKALILGVGEDYPARRPNLPPASLVICADGGVKLAEKWRLRPDVIIGDQDSISDASLRYWQKRQVQLIKYPAEKDHTDLELAVNFAVAAGVREISLFGAWGSRADHSLGNIALLYRLAKEGLKNELFTSKNRLTAISQGECTAETAVGSAVSLLPLDQEVKSVYTKGLYYPLSGQSLFQGTTLGVSNKAVAERVYVSCAAGVLLAVFEQ